MSVVPQSPGVGGHDSTLVVCELLIRFVAKTTTETERSPICQLCLTINLRNMLLVGKYLDSKQEEHVLSGP